MSEIEGQQQANETPQQSPEDQYVAFAKDLKEKGVIASEIRTALAEKGLSEEQQTWVMRMMNQEAASEIYHSENLELSEEEGGNGIPRFAIYIGILLLINLLSALFDWGFWIY